MEAPSRDSRLLLAIGLLVGGFAMACGSGVDEMRPGWFDKPTKVETHGRIVEKTYRYHNGPSTLHFGILEVDGKAVRIPGGAVEYAHYCEVDGIDAVGFSARGSDPAVYVLQVHGDQTILERLCDYKKSVHWDGAIYMPCEVGWDAAKREKIKRK